MIEQEEIDKSTNKSYILITYLRAPGWLKSVMRPILFFFNILFIFERNRDRVQVGKGQREGVTESEAGFRVPAFSTEPNAGLKLMNLEIMT